MTIDIVPVPACGCKTKTTHTQQTWRAPQLEIERIVGYFSRMFAVMRCFVAV